MTQNRNKNDGPTNGRPNSKVGRVPSFPWPVTPEAEDVARTLYGPLKRAMQACDDHAIQEAKRALENHPDAIAARLIENALQAVHLDSRVHTDAPWLGHFVMLMRELLADHVPGMTLTQMLRPLETAIRQNGGGRPPQVDPQAVVRKRTALEEWMHPSPTKEAAQQLGTSERNVRKIVAARKKRN